MATTTFAQLPIDLQERIYELKHQEEMKTVMEEIHEQVPKMLTTDFYDHPYDNRNWYAVWFDREIPLLSLKAIELEWEHNFEVDTVEADSDSAYDPDEFMDLAGDEATDLWYIPEMA